MELLCHSSPLLRCSYDVLLAICKEVSNPSPFPRGQEKSVQAFAGTCRHVRHLMAPELYKTIHIGPKWDWDRALSALESIEQCVLVRQYTRKFVIDLHTESQEPCPVPPEELPIKLATIAASLTKLETLTLIMPVLHTEPFRVAFETAQVSLPCVFNVNLNLRMDWIIPMCPAVNSISSQGWRSYTRSRDSEQAEQYTHNMVKAAGKAKNLQHFGMAGSTNRKLLESLFTELPNISSLSLTGGTGFPWEAAGIAGLAPIYSQFTNLQTLALPGVYYLGVGFYPPRCGNAYHGPNGAKVREQVQAKRREAEKKVARIMFGACAKLEVLRVGDRFKATCMSREIVTVLSMEFKDVEGAVVQPI